MRRVGISTCSRDPLGSGQYVFGCIRWLDPDDPHDAELLATRLDDFLRHNYLRPMFSPDRLASALRRVVSVWCRGNTSLCVPPGISTACDCQHCSNTYISPFGKAQAPMLVGSDSRREHDGDAIHRLGASAFEELEQALVGGTTPWQPQPSPITSPARDRPDASSAPRRETHLRLCQTAPGSESYLPPHRGHSSSPPTYAPFTRSCSQPDTRGVDLLDPFHADGGPGGWAFGDEGLCPADGDTGEWAADLLPAGDLDGPCSTVDAFLPRLLHPWP